MAKDLLDLHGCKIDDVWPKVDRFIRDAQEAGIKTVKIMPGKGTGKVREEMSKALKMGGFPFKPDKSGDGKINEGVFLVYLD